MAGASRKRKLFADLQEALESFFFSTQRLAQSFSRPAAAAEEKLRELRLMLDLVRATLRDADAWDVAGESAKLQLRELHAVACGAEEILEKVEFALRHVPRLRELQLELLSSGAAAAPPVREISSLSSFDSPGHLDAKIRFIRQRYAQLASHNREFRLAEEDGVRLPPKEEASGIPTTSFCDGKLHGREEDLQNVLRFLLPDVGRGALSVVSIVGMAGVGKTALAQHACNHDRVLSRFGRPIWVCASRGLDVETTTRTIIQACDGGAGDARAVTELDLLQSRLVDLLRYKTFLLVLDDAWCEDDDAWRRLLAPLHLAAGEGSRVLVTTRNTKVTVLACSHYTHHLGCLSDQSCLLICQQQAMAYGCSPESWSDSSLIDKKIIRKCKGLPLTARAVGSALRSGLGSGKWISILEQGLWVDDDLVDQILRRCLSFSYDRLPAPLKRCFAYSSLFPKDYLFDSEQLVRLWTGQGFIELSRGSPEDAGRNYFADLVEKCFFQQSPVPGLDHHGRYVMHDAYHELAQSVADREYLRIEDCKQCDQMDDNVRHASFVLPRSRSEITLKCTLFEGGHDLCTFLIINRISHGCVDEAPFQVELPHNLFLLSLRVLDLSNTGISVLPYAIGNLIHLRYLGLRNTNIKRLPESVSRLFLLQTLDLRHCCHLLGLPLGTKHLISLRNLLLPVRDGLSSWIHAMAGEV